MYKLLPGIILLIQGFLFVACDKEDGEKYTFILEKESVTIDFSGGEEHIEITANAGWTVQDVPDWIYFSPYEGDEFTTELYIYIEENEELEARSAMLTFTCGNITRMLEVRQLGLGESKPYLKIDFGQYPLYLTTFSSGSTHRVKIITNQAWQVTEMPDWIGVSRTGGDGYDEIDIQVSESRNKNGRSGTLVFKTKDLEAKLEIYQYGLLYVTRIPLLSVFRFKEMSYSASRKWYDFKLYSLFVNPGIKEKIYLGNLVSHHAEPHTDIPAFTGYTFNPITVTSSWGAGDSKTYIPSREEQQELARQITALKPAQGSSFVFDNNGEFYDYKQLYIVGMASLGIRLDEVVAGYSFTNREMSRNFGFIYSFKHTLFHLMMDYPVYPSLIREPLKETDKARGVSYVSRVSYGKVGLLVVESDADSRLLKPVVDKVIEDIPLSVEEKALVEEADFAYVYFTNDNEVQVLKGKTDAIYAYREAMEDLSENIYPVEFWLTGFDSHSDNEVSFKFDVPE